MMNMAGTIMQSEDVLITFRANEYEAKQMDSNVQFMIMRLHHANRK